jgi:cyclic pyranopterin phosphate synthase
MPEQGVILKNHQDIMSYELILDIVREAVKLGIKKVRLTGGEPLVRRNITYLIKSLKSIGGLSEVTLTTNGVLLAEMAEDIKKAGLDRISISLDTLDPQKYKELTRGGDIEPVLRGINAVLDLGFTGTKLNMVLIPGFNLDEVGDMKKFCQEKGIQLQRINHYSLRNINSINKKYVAERPLSCDLCNRIRLTSDGKLKPCLFSDEEIPVDPDNIKASLEKTIAKKPEYGTFCSIKQNWQIGG